MKKTVFLVILLLSASLFMRIYKLGKIPPGITNDEADVGYDAYSILKTGKDQWGNFMPLYFKGFGDYRLPVYTYAIVPSVAVFSLNAFSIRLPAVVFSIGTILGVYFLGKLLFSKKIGLIAAFLTAFSPWFIGMTRIAIESPVGVFFMVWGTVFFIQGLGKIKYLLLSVLFFVLGMYTYYAHRFIIPVYLVLLSLVYFKYIVRERRKFIISVLFFIFLLIPMIVSIFTSSGQNRMKQIVLTNDIGTLNNINDFRGACEKDMKPFVCKLTHNKYLGFMGLLFGNYLSHFSPETYFSSGLNSALSVKPDGAMFLLIELPALIAGLLYIIKRKTRESLLVLIWLIIAPIPDSLTSNGHYSRYFLVFPSIQLISAIGLVNILKKRYILSALVSVFTLISIYIFGSQYFGYFRTYYSQKSQYEYIPLFEKVRAYEEKYPAIYMSRKEYDTKQYIFYLFFNKYDPYLYQKGVGIDKSEGPDGWVKVERIGKWHFTDNLPRHEDMPQNSLAIGGSNEFKNMKVGILDRTQLLNGNDAFFIARNCTENEINEFNKNIIKNPIFCYYK